MRKIQYWVDKATGEVSGLGLTRIVDGFPVVVDAFLFNQECTPTTTELEENAVAKALYEHRESNGELNFWWHSHVNMQVFWSGTDDTTIKELGGQGVCYATVFNKRGETKTRYFQAATGLTPHFDFDNINLQMIYDKKNAPKEWEDQFNEKVKVKTYNYNRNGNSFWDGYGDYNDWRKDWRWNSNRKCWEKKKDKKNKNKKKKKEIVHIEPEKITVYKKEFRPQILAWRALPFGKQISWKSRYQDLFGEYYLNNNNEFVYALFFDKYKKIDEEFWNAEWQQILNKVDINDDELIYTEVYEDKKRNKELKDGTSNKAS